ncbi:Transcriptional regulator, TetR family [Flavobacterium sp. 9AF]|uniref:TetR/AcrR family transcriptional regulator n=1 Tax=Flavobacterium sp. 9AF TaxID=2653142 RepID=UPI0012F24C91|nr:TetR/AcrR family transcriptional regulator [Flavobacterium sp. 9AF]VXB97284.1 Transcriptional regulator, TetR family [Flavobacterium sp. 9AF]
MKKAAATRMHILQKAFELIYEKGYQTTSIDDILATTKVTKGAFYYHFKNKEQMGIAIINELLKPTLTASFIAPLESKENPLDIIYNLMEHLLLQNDFLRLEYGCPVANFTQEMTPWNIDFSNALHEITQLWISSMTDLLEKGKKEGVIKDTINANALTVFVMSGYWGIRNFGKLENSKNVYTVYLEELKRYLGSMK